ncbi:MAG: spondin domain-containing protein [Pseudomonadota bacterium]
MRFVSKVSARFSAVIVACGLSTAAAATTLNITVTNNQPAGGFSITPLYLGFHNDQFDAFNAGEAASPGVEEIAETGMAGVVAGERLAADPNSQGLVIASPTGAPPIQPGESESAQITLNPTDALFLTFLSMVLPSNDTFIGSDDPIQLFDSSGNFLGDQIIEVTREQTYDAGTEVNGLTGAAFLANEDISLGDAENGIITPVQDLTEFAGQELVTGDILGDATLLDFFSDTSNPSFVTISISEVNPIPLPASAPLLLAALGLMGWRRFKA